MHYKTLRGRGPSYDGVDQECSKSITTEQQQYIKKCLFLAKKSNLTQKHGCVIVRNKETKSLDREINLHAKVSEWYLPVPFFEK